MSRKGSNTQDEVNVASRDKWERGLGLMVYLGNVVQL